jgi:L-lactate dehydrogenase complex protein LldG
MENNSRQNILEKISAAQTERSVFFQKEIAQSIYKPILPDSLICFKNELESINGRFILCDDENDLYQKLKLFVDERGLPFLYCRDNYIASQLKKNEITFSNQEADFLLMEAGITGCEFMIARTGSVVVSSATQSGRQMNVFPPIHIVLANISQLLDYPEDAYNAIQQKYGDALPSNISTITGPSRTADIEKTLVLGAHGPKEFIVFITRL